MTTSRGNGRCSSMAIAATLAGLSWATASAHAAPFAATICPPSSFVNTTNLADNPSFETVGANGNPSICAAPCGPPYPESAAADWTIHSDNFGAAVTTRLEPLSVLDPRREPYGTDPKRETRMLHIIPGGNEGGVIQIHRGAPAKVMFQVWVYVRRGHVLIQPHGGGGGPGAWSTKKNQWEELRVCTDGTAQVDAFIILNQDPSGGDFFVDRAEIRETP
jgi:hypothetical protein